MSVLALRTVVPSHELTICGASDGKVGSCRCGMWFVAGQATSDDVTVAYLDHLLDVGAVHPAACDQCQSGLATVRRGVVELCSRCAWVEYRVEIDADVLAASA